MEKELERFQKSIKMGTTSRYKTVEYIQFSIQSPNEIIKNSVCEVNNTILKQQ